MTVLANRAIGVFYEFLHKDTQHHPEYEQQHHYPVQQENMGRNH